MRKSFFAALITLSFVTASTAVSAQSATGSDYENAIGLGIDFGDGSTLVGPSFKHFFTENSAGNAELLFGDGLVGILAYYQYHKEIEGAEGLRWYAGGGPGVLLGDDNSAFVLRPMAGLDYKINQAPLSLSFDWRPFLIFGDNDSDFQAARFGLGIRYTWNSK